MILVLRTFCIPDDEDDDDDGDGRSTYFSFRFYIWREIERRGAHLIWQNFLRVAGRFNVSINEYINMNISSCR